MRRLLLSAALLSTLAVPAIGQVTLQLGNQQQGDPRDQQSDTQRDQERDAQRDAQRDAERDRQHDADRRAGYQASRDRYDQQREQQQQQYYGYNGRDDQRDWRFDGTPYRVNPYTYPQGGGYRKRVAGDYVSRAYRAPERYWIGNPPAYRLSPALSGTRWIRIGQDALMVRMADGIIVSSVRGLFS